MCEVLLRHSRCCYVQGHMAAYSYLLCTLAYVLFYPHTLEHTHSPPSPLKHSCSSTPTPPAPTQSLPHLNAVAESFPSFLAAQTSLLANSKRCLFFRSTTSFWKLCTYITSTRNNVSYIIIFLEWISCMLYVSRLNQFPTFRSGTMCDSQWRLNVGKIAIFRLSGHVIPITYTPSHYAYARINAFSGFHTLTTLVTSCCRISFPL